MSQKLKSYLITLVGSITLLMPALVPSIAHADVNGNLCTGVTGANSGTNLTLNPANNSNGSCTQDSQAGNTLGHILNEVINVFSLIVGVVSVIMIIVGGFRYITSGGNDQSLAGAKNTIIYALIGLVIVALAQIIVHYVLSRLGQAGVQS